MARIGVCSALRNLCQHHGILLLERGLDEYRLSSTFHQVSLAEDSEPQVPVGADFAGFLQLAGLDRDLRPIIRPEPVVQISNY